jgi:TonB-linked SusC/RagA family outer membrane protein
MITKLLVDFKQSTRKISMKVFLVLIFLGITSVLNAQQVTTINGTVKDGNDVPLPGVSVAIQATQTGTVSDIDGRYRIKVKNGNTIITYSYLGFLSQQVKVGAQTTINVVLKEDTRFLDEIIVVGYGELAKSDITGAVSTFKNVNSVETNSLSTAQMLQGQVAGLQITQNTGVPGGASTISIRGQGSITGSGQPLFVIDGVPFENNYINPSSNGDFNTNFYANTVPPTDVLSTINPNDIASIQVLKDASSTAIYGSRGANGVILITTKQGVAGRPSINYTFRTDMTQIRKQYDVLDAKDYMNYVNEGRLNYGLSPTYTTDSIARQKSTNWQDLIFQTGVSQDHQLSLSGGDKISKFLVTGGFTDAKGVIINSDYSRGSGRVNYNRNLTERLTLNLNIFGSFVKTSRLAQGYNQGLRNGILNGAIFTTPLERAFALDEFGDESDQINQELLGNPLTFARDVKDIIRSSNVSARGGLTYKLIDGLTLKYDGAYTFARTRRDVYYPRSTDAGRARQGVSLLTDGNNRNFLSSASINYNKVLYKKHSINAVGGVDWQKWDSEDFSISGIGYPNDVLQGRRLGLASSYVTPSTSSNIAALASVIARFVYSYDKKYIITLTNRADGSSRLATGNKWKYFPALGGRWNVSNEKFFNKEGLFSDLSLRASYGVSGNQSIGIGSSQERMGTSQTVLGGALVTGITYTNIANPNLNWETTTAINGGFDLSIKNDKFRISGEVYQKRTTDLLFNLPIPTSTGFGIMPINAGEIENYGLELEANADVLTKTKLKWKTNANWSANRNKVINLGPSSQIFGQIYFPVVPFNFSQPISLTTPGQPIGVFYGYRIKGIYQNQQEVNDGPEKATAQPGDFKFLDISGPNGVPDGVINDFDKTIIGNPYPDFTFGWNNNFTYKKFSLSFLFQGVIGQDVANLNRILSDALQYTALINVGRAAYEGRWTGEGTSNYYPKINNNNMYKSRASDFLIEDASFVRLRTLTLGYSFSVKNVLKSVKVFVTGNNLLTFTNYTGLDPEVNILGNNAINQGIDQGGIPNVRAFSFGLTTSF